MYTLTYTTDAGNTHSITGGAGVWMVEGIQGVIFKTVCACCEWLNDVD